MLNSYSAFSDIRNCAIANHYNGCHSTIKYSNKTFSINIIDKCNEFLDRKIIISEPDLNRNTGLYLTTQAYITLFISCNH